MVQKTYSFIKNGKQNDVYTLTNENGLKAEILTYGARLISLFVPNDKGELVDVIVGCATPEEYYDQKDYFGATVGRYCNRIGEAKFTLNQKEYILEKNNGQNTLHGGNTTNFDRIIWSAEIKGEGLVLSHFSPDGAGGYPGNMQVQVVYTLTDDNALDIKYYAKSDMDTICNLTNHAYFNLGAQTILQHELMINAKKITKCGLDLIPHGEFLDIDGTDYSFMPPKQIGKDIFSKEQLIEKCGGYDFNYCLERKTKKDLELCAYLYNEANGVMMECFTTKPGLQIYTGNGTGGFKGKRGYIKHCAVCLETQFYPNTPNCPEYPSCTLKAGEEYNHQTVYKFSVE
ncbi:MAG: galactose mutarotase [Clostridia bacterium]|nr:galactose mutarotase [Clostridia bacterium]